MSKIISKFEGMIFGLVWSFMNVQNAGRNDEVFYLLLLLFLISSLPSSICIVIVATAIVMAIVVVITVASLQGVSWCLKETVVPHISMCGTCLIFCQCKFFMLFFQHFLEFPWGFRMC